MKNKTKGKEKQLGKYMVVYQLNRPKLKTEVWAVHTSSNDFYRLGEIKWFSAWRQYTFQPEPLSIFNSGCLDELTKFVSQLNKKHKITRVTHEGKIKT